MQQLSQEERRKSIRYRPKDGTMAVNSYALGPIINISMGGFSFRYLEGTPVDSSSDSLGVFLGSDDILIEQLGARVVSDILISEGSAFLKTSTRLRSVQFVNLAETQRKQLQDFISKKTKGTY